jgi:hypothetical protein
MSIDDAWHANPAQCLACYPGTMLGMLTWQHHFKLALPSVLLDIPLATELSNTINESELACQMYKDIATCRYCLVLIATDKY